jgi:polar amino acid transport system substrate-binding protein
VLEKVLLYVGQLDDLQQQQIRDSAARIRNDIDTSLLLMGGIGLAALLIGLAFAWSARSITRPWARRCRSPRAWPTATSVPPSR